MWEIQEYKVEDGNVVVVFKFQHPIGSLDEPEAVKLVRWLIRMHPTALNALLNEVLETVDNALRKCTFGED